MCQESLHSGTKKEDYEFKANLGYSKNLNQNKQTK